jgi:hypothetical protein
MTIEPPLNSNNGTDIPHPVRKPRRKLRTPIPVELSAYMRSLVEKRLKRYAERVACGEFHRSGRFSRRNRRSGWQHEYKVDANVSSKPAIANKVSDT